MANKTCYPMRQKPSIAFSKPETIRSQNMYSLQSGSQQKRENMTLYRRETSFSLSVAKIKTRQHVIKKLLNMFEVILEPHYKFF